MVGHGSPLNRKMEEAIAALLPQRSIEDAAKATGIGTQTLIRRLKRPEFDSAYREARRDAFSAKRRPPATAIDSGGFISPQERCAVLMPPGYRAQIARADPPESIATASAITSRRAVRRIARHSHRRAFAFLFRLLLAVTMRPGRPSKERRLRLFGNLSIHGLREHFDRRRNCR